MVKVQMALFPAASVKVYVTEVLTVAEKESPELWLLDVVGVAPELSLTLGSCHVTTTGPVPRKMVRDTSGGQKRTWGGVRSTETQKKIVFKMLIVKI